MYASYLQTRLAHNLWGSEEWWRFLVSNPVRSSNIWDFQPRCAIIMFDVTSRLTYLNVSTWHRDLCRLVCAFIYLYLNWLWNEDCSRQHLPNLICHVYMCFWWGKWRKETPQSRAWHQRSRMWDGFKLYDIQNAINNFYKWSQERRGKIQEGLLDAVIALGRDFIILMIILPVEGHLLWPHLPVLHMNLVCTYHDRDVVTRPVEGKDTTIFSCKQLLPFPFSWWNGRHEIVAFS